MTCTHGVHTLVHQGRAPGSEGRGGCRSPGSKHLSFGCPSPAPVSCLCFKPPSKGHSLHHNIAQFTLNSFPLSEKAPLQAELILTQRTCPWWPLDLLIQGAPFPGVRDGQALTRGSSGGPRLWTVLCVPPLPAHPAPALPDVTQIFLLLFFFLLVCPK